MFWKWWSQKNETGPVRRSVPNLPKFELRILKETDHYAFIAPPSKETLVSQVLEEWEFIRSMGYRPLYAMTSQFIPGLEGVICEKLFVKEDVSGDSEGTPHND